MRRTSCAAVGAALALLAAACSGRDVPTHGTSHLESARLGEVQRVADPPKARFTRTTVAATSLADSTTALDACAGPVAVQLGDDRPVLVAEHDYCGGSAWISRLRRDDAVALDGVGVVADTYVVTGLETEHRGEARVRDLPAAHVVLQTCISPGEIVLVSLDRYQPALVTS